MRLESATLVKYNANTRGTNTGDCTARAISLAFNMDYSKARKALNDSAKEHRGWNYNTHANCEEVIRNLGGGNIIDPVRKITVNDFADMHANDGTYILWCSKDGEKFHHTNHLVCMINDRIYDSWDSRTFYVIGYWEIKSGIKAEDITDVGQYLTTWIRRMDADGYRNYANQVFDNIINKNRKLKKLIDKYDISVDLYLQVTEVALHNYTFKFGYAVRVDIPKYDILEKWYKSRFAIVFKPTMKTDEVDAYFEETFYNKLYSFLQGIIREIEDMCEGHALLYKDSETTIPKQQNLWFYSQYAKKSFNNLPYWVRRLATSFRIEQPFQERYSDSVELYITTPPFDSDYDKNCEKDRYFHAYNMDDLKRGLDYYKETGNYDKAYAIAADW